MGMRPSRRDAGPTVPLPPDVVLGDLAGCAPGDLVDRADLDGVEVTELDDGPVSMRDATVIGCRFAGCRGPELDLSGAAVRESELRQLDVVVLRASRGRWNDVRVAGGRLGVLEAYDGAWGCVELVGCKVGLLNLRGSQVTDLVLRDCVIEELLFDGATVRRVALPGTRVGQLGVREAQLSDVDLRGADLAQISDVVSLRGTVVDAAQLALLAPVLAAELGIEVAEG